MFTHDTDNRTKSSLRPLRGELANWRTAIGGIVYDRCAESMKRRFSSIQGKAEVVWDYDIETVIRDIDKELASYPEEQRVFQKEAEKARFLMKHGYVPNPDNTRAEESPNVTTPELQLLWGATISQLAIHPEKMKEWPESEQSKTGDVGDTNCWKQFVENPTLKDYLSEYSYIASRAGVNPGTTIGWGRPGSWFWCAPSYNHINSDLAFSLIFGLDPTSAIVLHEIGHSQHSLGFTEKMAQVHGEMSEIMERSQKAEKFSGPDQVRYNYLIHKFHLMQDWHYHIEENPIDFFANTYGDSYAWLMAKADALRVGMQSPNKLGVEVKAEKLRKPEEKMKIREGTEAAEEAGQVLAARKGLLSGFYGFYNGYTTDDDIIPEKDGRNPTLEAAKLTRQDYELIKQVLGAEHTEGLDGKFDTIYSLSGVKPRGQMRLQPLPNLPSGLLESPIGKTRRDIAETYCDARNAIIDEMWMRYAEPLAEKYLSQLPTTAEDIYLDFLKEGLPGENPGDEGDRAMEEEMERSGSSAEEIKEQGEACDGEAPEPKGRGKPGGQGGKNRTNNKDPELPEDASVTLDKLTQRFKGTESKIEELYRKLLLGQPIYPQPQKGADHDSSWDLPNDPDDIDEDTMISRWREIKSGMPRTRQSYEWQEEEEDPKPQPAKRTKIDVVFLLDSSGSVQGDAFNLGLTAGGLLYRPATKVNGINVYAGLLGNPRPYVIAQPGDSNEKTDREFAKVATSQGLSGDGDKVAVPLSVFLGKIAENNRTLFAPSHHTHFIVASDAAHTDGSAGFEKLEEVLANKDAHVTIDYLIIGHANRQIFELAKKYPEKMKIRQCNDINRMPNDVLELLTERVASTQRNLTNVNLTTRLAALDAMGEKEKSGKARTR